MKQNPIHRIDSEIEALRAERSGAIVKLYQQLGSQVKVARSLGISKQRVHQILKAEHVPSVQQQQRELVEQHIGQYLEDGTPAEMARDLNVSHSIAVRYFRKHDPSQKWVLRAQRARRQERPRQGTVSSKIVALWQRGWPSSSIGRVLGLQARDAASRASQIRARYGEALVPRRRPPRRS